MKLGRKLDSLIANKIMGVENPETPYYSTDITSAWEVIEKVKDLGFQIEISHGLEESGIYLTKKDEGNCQYIWVRNVEGIPHAICRAALKAVEEAP